MSTYFKNISRFTTLLVVIALALFGNGNALGGAVVHAQTELSSAPLPEGWQNYIDSEYGFQVGYPVQDWTGEVTLQNDAQAGDIVLKRFSIRNEKSAVINIDVWNNSTDLGIPEWIDIHRENLLDATTTIPTTSNVTIGGTDGFLIVQPPNPEQQSWGRTITILSSNGFIYWIEYIAQDGGAAQDIYMSMLETFAFETKSTRQEIPSPTPSVDSRTPEQNIEKGAKENVEDARDYIEIRSANATSSFSKKEPSNGATGVATTVTLKWEAPSSSPIKYRYAISTSSTSKDWNSVYGSTQVTVKDLSKNTKYYWQVQAVYCDTCTPKEVVSANSGSWWSFTTTTSNITISGNAGIGGVILSYTDGTAKTVTAGTDGSYSITVPYNWSGTVTPSKTGYTFFPANKGYTNLTTDQTAQNYTALVTISGNAGIGGATLSYTDGTAKTVTAGTDGSYSITVPYKWSGIVTPSKTGYIFSPANKSYSAVQTNLTSQNYAVLITISGNVQVSGVKLTYTGGEAISDANGGYSFTVPYNNWISTVTPSHPCYSFDPASLSYGNPTANQTHQDYAATLKPEGCVLSITRADPDVTKAASVRFIVKFSKDVLGVDVNDFELTVVGVSETSISPTIGGSGNTYQVTVNTGTGNGSIRLDVRASASITNSEGTQIVGLPFTSGQAYTIMKTKGVITPADFNGDGKTDLAVFRPSNGTWYISGIGPAAYGQSSDIPVPADYNGDGKDDIAVFRPSNGTWYISGVGPAAYGQPGDIPVPADYNGDGKAEMAVFRPSNSTWYVRGVGAMAVYGAAGDIPVVADYNGDGKAEIAVFREANSTWYVRGVGAMAVYGTAGDIPVVADYNGDGKAEIAVFRPSNGTWYIYGIGPTVYGTVGDIPMAADYNGDGKADMAVFRPSNGTWYLYGIGPTIYGTNGDIPV